MTTPPSTAHTVFQPDAGAVVTGAEVTVVEVAVESGPGLVATVSTAPCARATGLPPSASSSESSSNGRLPTLGKPAGWSRRSRGLVERLRVMKHLG